MTKCGLLLGTMTMVATQCATAAYDTQHFTATNIVEKSLELCAPNSSAKPAIKKMNDGSDGAERVCFKFTAKHTGAYKIAFRYASREVANDNIQLRVSRTDNEQTIRFQFFDYLSGYCSERSKFDRLPKHRAEDRWESLDINFEMPGEYVLRIEGAYGITDPDRFYNWGARAPAPVVSDVWISDDPGFNGTEAKPQVRISDAELVYPEVKGFTLARDGMTNGRFNSTIPQRDRLQFCLHECYPFYQDIANSVDLGINMNLQGYNPILNYDRYGIQVTGNVDFGPDNEFWKWYSEEQQRIAMLDPDYRAKKEADPNAKIQLPPAAEHLGKAANSRGEYQRDFSYSYKPYLEACYRTAAASTKDQIGNDNDRARLNWYSAWEQCGTYDYGEASLDTFRHEYLPKKYGSLEGLNKAWHQDFRSFDDVVPATYYDCVGKNKLTNDLALARAKASFLDFRDFNSKAYASWLGLKTKAIQENDPEKRNMTSAYSNNNLGSICWLKWRPLSFEDAMELTLKGSKTMGWDIYGTDDLIAEAYEHWYSFGNGECHPMIKEANIHALGPELCARSFWNLLGEGMRGMAFFTGQESPKPELRKFGMHNPDDDMAPRPKAAAVSDVFRAAEQIEPWISYSNRRLAGKPVAIFYSQNCNVMQDRGYGSMFDCAPDSHMRVFEMIRACGYPCTIITEEQILNKNKLDDVCAVFFVDAQYLDAKVIDKLIPWVEAGGHVVADGQTGCYDAHGFPTTKMIDFLRIKPIKRERVDETVAENLAFGYSSQAFNAVNPDELWLTMREYVHQRDARHPLNKALGKIMISGFGAQEVQSLDGHVVILGNDGQVGWNICDVGKGTVSYFAGYLGTIYGAGCTQYEWRDAHSDDSAYRLMDTLLKYFGARKNAETSLEEHLNLRYGSPQIDDNGNILQSFTSFANHRLPSFKVRSFLPAGAVEPRALYITTDSNRKVTKVDFDYNKENNTVEFTMPSFRVFGTVLMAQEQKYPLVSVDFGECPRDCYRLADFRPGQEQTIKVKVFNPSSSELKTGTISMYIPDGWFYDKNTVEVEAIPAFGESKEFTFKVKAPAVCASRRLKPINFVFRSGNTISTPSCEMVWFQNAAQEEKNPMR